MRYLDYRDILVVMPLLLTSLFILDKPSLDPSHTFMVFVLGYIVFNIVDKH